METQLWVLLVVVVLVAAAFVYWRSLQTRVRQDQDHRMNVQAQGQALSAAAEISQREDRRLAGMATEDREWEQASLQRHRDSQARTGQPEVSANQEVRR